MTDPQTGGRVEVRTGGDDRPYVIVGVKLSEALMKLLEANGIACSVDDGYIDRDAVPPAKVVNLDPAVDVCRVQAILDGAD